FEVGRMLAEPERLDDRPAFRVDLVDDGALVVVREEAPVRRRREARDLLQALRELERGCGPREVVALERGAVTGRGILEDGGDQKGGEREDAAADQDFELTNTRDLASACSRASASRTRPS